MSLRQEFDDAAKALFDDFGDVVVDIVYIHREVTQAPGGDNTVQDTRYPIRAIFDAHRGLQTDSAPDTDSEERSVMVVTSELPVPPDRKDKLEIDGDTHVILGWEQDPAAATTVFTTRRA